MQTKWIIVIVVVSAVLLVAILLSVLLPLHLNKKPKEDPSVPSPSTIANVLNSWQGKSSPAFESQLGPFIIRSATFPQKVLSSGPNSSVVWQNYDNSNSTNQQWYLYSSGTFENQSQQYLPYVGQNKTNLIGIDGYNLVLTSDFSNVLQFGSLTGGDCSDFIYGQSSDSIGDTIYSLISLPLNLGGNTAKYQTFNSIPPPDCSGFDNLEFALISTN
jgi:hypothetical protein